jgi:NAD-dependent dihydropyrimidine dehydrogenase PreA subunit
VPTICQWPRAPHILDQSPVLELLRRPDGSIGGARGIRRQNNNAPYRIESGALVLATGGTSFMSHLLGSHTNTGDGYLMAAEAGADLSGMEFTAAYTVAPKHSTMTRSMSYAFATYYDSDGHEVAPAGPTQMPALARQLLRGPVFCSLHCMPQDIRAHLPTISPNLMLPFDRWGIDPFTDRFEVTLHNDGTIRGTGGVRVANADCATSVPGLFVAGDVATRELVAGAISGGGAQNSAWTLSSGHWAGRGAVAFARSRKHRAKERLIPLGWGRLASARRSAARRSAGRRAGGAGRDASLRQEPVSDRREIALVQGHAGFRLGRCPPVERRRRGQSAPCPGSRRTAGHRTMVARRGAGAQREPRPASTPGQTGDQSTLRDAHRRGRPRRRQHATGKPSCCGSIGAGTVIEAIIADRCTSCRACVDVCPTNVFDTGADGRPVIARQADCQTCFMCELYCKADALYVAPDCDRTVPVDTTALIASGLLGQFRRHSGWDEWQGQYPNEHWLMDGVFKRARG